MRSRRVLLIVAIFSLLAVILYYGQDAETPPPPPPRENAPSGNQFRSRGDSRISATEVETDPVGGRNPDDSPEVLADSASRYANLSSAFVKKFCQKVLQIENRPKVCLYDLKEDIFVSTKITREGLWDPKGVRQVMKALHDCEGSGERPVFLDLGANIGSFTLPALSAGFETLSVEPMDSALTRLATAVSLNQLSDRWRLLPFAVTDRSACLKVNVNQKNKGGSEVQYVPCTATHNLQSIPLDHLMQFLPEQPTPVVMKMDIQRYEPYAILSGRQLFTHHQVKLLYLEWAEMKQALAEGTNPEYMEKTEQAMHFLMHDLGFSVYDHDSLRKLDWANRLQWSNNIFMLKGDIHPA